MKTATTPSARIPASHASRRTRPTAKIPRSRAMWPARSCSSSQPICALAVKR